jgi:hypothetical protein
MGYPKAVRLAVVGVIGVTAAYMLQAAARRFARLRVDSVGPSRSVFRTDMACRRGRPPSLSPRGPGPAGKATRTDVLYADLELWAPETP